MSGVSGGLQEPGSSVELFRSDDLLVRQVAGFGSEACVVTFDSFTDYRTLDRAGFGEGFLRSRRIDAIHVISRENDWYQYAETLEAMAAVRAATGAYRRVVTYGSSMGAYAAIRLAGAAGAHCALALSPQASIDPAVVPFERRWEEASRRFQGVWERSLPYPELDEAYVVYDPQDIDARHVRRLRRAFRFTPVPLPGAGHPVTGYLLELGLLEDLVQQACRGPVDVAALQARAWAGRQGSAQHFVVRAMRARRRATRIAMLREAVRLAPANPDCLCRLGVSLGMAGRFEEAKEAHLASLALMPGHPNLLLHYSRTLERRGDRTGALEIVEQAEANSGSGSLYRARAARLRAMSQGRREGWRSWWRALRGRLDDRDALDSMASGG